MIRLTKTSPLGAAGFIFLTTLAFAVARNADFDFRTVEEPFPASATSFDEAPAQVPGNTQEFPTTIPDIPRPDQTSKGVPSGCALDESLNFSHCNNSTEPSTRGDTSASTTASTPTEGTRFRHRNRWLLPEKSCGMAVATKIFGGREADLEEFPWMALIRSTYGTAGVFGCGGSLITYRYVLTAAHCVTKSSGLLDEAIDKVRLGEHDLRSRIDCQDKKCNSPPKNMAIEEIIVHPDYVFDETKLSNDIALIRLAKPVKLNRFVQPICLPLDELQTKNNVGKSMWTAGWGTTEKNKSSSTKLKVKLPVYDTNVCAENFGSFELSESDICAGGEKNRDSCSGDSGGPLMKQEVVARKVRWVQYGIVSAGYLGCGREGNPGIYTNVGNYLNWILDNIHT